jgi:hypothetical protein
MRDQSVLHEKAAAAVLSGRLPARRPERTWGGPGTGAACAVCDLPVAKTELEHEFEMHVTGGVENAGLTHVHEDGGRSGTKANGTTRPMVGMAAAMVAEAGPPVKEIT